MEMMAHRVFQPTAPRLETRSTSRSSAHTVPIRSVASATRNSKQGRCPDRLPTPDAGPYWIHGGTENSPLAYFGGYTTLAEPSVYHWITTIEGAPSS